MKPAMHLGRASRSLARAHALAAVAALGLAAVPLFQLVGFEFAAAIGCILTYVAGWRSCGAAARARADRTAAEAAFPGRSLLWVGVENLTLLATPLAVMALHSRRVPTCNWSQGLAFYALLPIPGVLYGTALGFASGLAFSLRRARLVFVLWSLATYAHALWNLVAEPPKFAFNAFVGYFPGPIYDAQVAITPALVVARATVVLQACLGVLLALLAWDAGRLRLPSLARRWRAERAAAAAVAVVLAAALVLLHVFAAPLGTGIDRRYIQRALGGHLETAHFHLYYDRTGITAARAAALADEHEFRHAQLVRFFGFAPPRRIGSYVYGSAERKKRLMGAGGTSFEDALHDEFHINFSADEPHPALTHEMAHIFAAHLVPRVPVCWKIGIHEGIAVAAEWAEESARLEMTPHQACAAMDSLGLLPDLEGALSAFGFWTLPGARAYTACGSFARFLVDRDGMGRFRRLWRRGDFDAAYGKPLRALLLEWRAAVAASGCGPAELRRAERLFRPQSIFAQPCAHELARLEARAAGALAAGDAALAESLYARLASIDPDEMDHALDLGRARLWRRDPAGARQVGLQVLAEPRAGPWERERAWRLVGDSAWWVDDRAAAESAYARGAELAASSGGSRALEVSRRALGSPSLSLSLRGYLTDAGLPDPAGLALLGLAMANDPDAGLPRYLLGRRLLFAGSPREAATELRTALDSGDLGPEATLAALELLGRALLSDGHPREAEEVFEGLSAWNLPEWRLLGAGDWRTRCGWALSRIEAEPPSKGAPDGMQPDR